MLHIRNVLLLVLLLFAVKSKSQGLNNPYSIDSIDIQKALELEGISIFKFPLSLNGIIQDDTSYHTMNVIIEEYKHGKLAEASNSLQALSKQFSGSALQALFPRIADDTSLLRIYCKTTAPRGATIILQTGSRYSRRFDFVVDSSLRGLHQFRAFDFRGLDTGKRIPLIVYYGNEPSKTLLFCPSSAPPLEVARLYDHAIIIYGELTLIE